MAYKDQQFTGGSVRENVTLASNATAAGNYPDNSGVTVYGGDYVFSVSATAWNGASAQLQALGPDGTSYQNLGAAKTANDATGGTGFGLGSNARMRVAVTGSPTGFYATLSRIPA